MHKLSIKIDCAASRWHISPCKIVPHEQPFILSFTTDVLDCLKCPLPISYLVAVLSAACGLYLSNYLQEEEKQNNRTDPEI